jgi:hypothetical protein
MSSLSNILLKARSGAAVTIQENRRFLNEVMTGAGMSETALRHGWNNVLEEIETKKQNILAGYDDKILAAYNRNNPTPFERRDPRTARLGTSAATTEQRRDIPTKSGRPAAPAAADTPPPGVSAAAWRVMPPEDRALFKPK